MSDQKTEQPVNLINHPDRISYRGWVENPETGNFIPVKFDVIPGTAKNAFTYQGKKVIPVAYLKRPDNGVQVLSDVHPRTPDWIKDIKKQSKEMNDALDKFRIALTS